MTAAAARRDEPYSQREPRWLVRRRAEAAAGMVKAETVAPEQACFVYGVSVAQFEAWSRSAERMLGGGRVRRKGRNFTLR